MNAIRSAALTQDLSFQCRKIAMLGSGPLPITSILAQKFWGRSVSMLNVDRDAVALQVSSDLIQSCNLANMHFLQCDVAVNPPDLRDCDVVYLAGMVGHTAEEKSDVILKVVGSMRVGALLILRTTHSLGVLVYGKLDVEAEVLARFITPLVSIYYHSELPRSFHVVSVDAMDSTGWCGEDSGLHHGHDED